ncbi:MULTISPECIES: hypothetical protein [Citrobacter]|nr:MULTISPECIES: hypothetical protein [Citrobacter]CEJ63547.1 hypothetical protein [Citrobacter pasteurii]
MNTVLNSREEALNRGKLINLDDEALDAGSGHNSFGPQALS